MAVRSDPDAPADLRSRQRSHEGAVRAQETTPDYPIRPKDVQHNDEKTRIGETRLVKPNQTVILDSGATAAAVARQLRQARPGPLAAGANSLDVALELTEAPIISVIMLGE